MEICMNKKRVTAVILSAMMCMQIFTGCGAKNNAAAVEGGAGQTATESAQGAAGTVTEENAQTAEENVQGTADQDGTEESMTGMMPQNGQTAQKFQFLRMANIRWKSH